MGLIGVLATGCATHRAKPCTEGGQSARDITSVLPFRGSKRCYQSRDPASGLYMNHGKYFEWFENDQIALTGEYKMGKKQGRWIEYDEKGNKTSDRYYEEGKEVPRP